MRNENAEQKMKSFANIFDGKWQKKTAKSNRDKIPNQKKNVCKNFVLSRFFFLLHFFVQREQTNHIVLHETAMTSQND